MKLNWGGLARVLAPRLVGAGVAFATGWLTTRTNGAVSIDPKQITEMIIAYGLAHTAVASSINPVGAASPVVAQAGVDVKKDATAEYEAKQ